MESREGADFFKKNKFSMEFKDVLDTMKLLGWFPFSPRAVVKDNGQIGFTAPLWAILYCIAMLSAVTITNTYFAVQGIKVAALLPERIQFFGYLFVFSTAFANYVPILAFLQSGSRRKMIVELYNTEREMESHSLTGAIIERVNLRVYNKIALFLTILFSCAIMSRALSTRLTITDFWIALGLINEGIIFTWLVFLAQFMKVYMKIEAEEFAILSEYNESGKNEKPLNLLLLEHRRIWLNMLSLLNRVGNIVSMCVGSMMLVNFGRCLYALYMILSNRIALVLVLFLVYALCPIILECHFCHSVSQEVYDKITEAIEVTKVLKISKNRKIETLRFFGKLANLIRPISFNFYMDCDRKLLTTVLAALLTNAIIIVQLNVGEQDFNLEDYNTICELIHLKIVSAFIP